MVWDRKRIKSPHVPSRAAYIMICLDFESFWLYTGTVQQKRKKKLFSVVVFQIQQNFFGCIIQKNVWRKKQ